MNEGYRFVQFVNEGEFVATDWYYASGASNPIPCRWEGWLNGERCVINLMSMEN